LNADSLIAEVRLMRQLVTPLLNSFWWQ